VDGWVVASDRVSRIVLPAAYRAGSQVAQGAQRVPEKWGHAVDQGAEQTLCGLPVRGLFRFDALLFEHLGHHLRCRVCDEVAGHPHASPVSGHRRQASTGAVAAQVSAGEAGGHGGDPLVGGGEGDADVTPPGGAVEAARGDEDPEPGEVGDGVPAVLVTGGPEIEGRL